MSCRKCFHDGTRWSALVLDFIHFYDVTILRLQTSIRSECLNPYDLTVISRFSAASTTHAAGRLCVNNRGVGMLCPSDSASL